MVDLPLLPNPHLIHQETSWKRTLRRKKNTRVNQKTTHYRLSCITLQIWSGANANQNPLPYHPWLVPDVVIIPRILHDMPKHPEKFFPKFDPDQKDSVEDHVKKFLLSVRLQNIQYEDVVCQLFPLTFENKYSTWFFSLEEASITSWRTFETIFLRKFGENKMPTTLVLELSRIKMDSKELVNDYNQCFLTLLK
jgi:hypothetical protein